ncbi:unnamed protein product [Pedinophyceae sp. YPF-701]|nr:unnamed protein product [Pedinophyceae sp. YPF-701]
MCGIFGYYFISCKRSRRTLLDALLNGLRRLEYRGYDSAGLSFDVDGAIQIVKSVGKVDELATCVKKHLGDDPAVWDAMLEGESGIAHTRWATHGPPATVNSHPHTSGDNNDFVVVHNGIITNYATLKKYLISKGATFVSETDTEVIPKLLHYLYERHEGKISLRDLVLDVMARLDGAFALLIKSKRYPGEIVACKRGSPLLVGIKTASHMTPGGSAPRFDLMSYTSDGPLEVFLASDASAIVEHTKQVAVLEDNDLVHVAGNTITMFSAEAARRSSRAEGASGTPATEVRGAPASRVTETLNMEVAEIMKGGYDHFMMKEIMEQPEAIGQGMRGRLRADLKSLEGLDPRELAGRSLVHLGGLVDNIHNVLRSRRIMFVACGTSFHAALCARELVEELTQLPVSLELASDLMDRRCPMFRDDTVVFVSQSGETADTLQALHYAKSKGALCFGITNTVGSAIARATHCGIFVNAGAEIGVASTKAYTCQVVAITMMALMLSQDSLHMLRRREEIAQGLRDLPDQVAKALLLNEQIAVLAEELKSEVSILLFGRGYNYATALEGALKIKEVSYIHSEGLLSGEMKHGPLALVDPNLPLIVIATRDACYAKNQSVLQQLKARGGRLIVICNEGDDEVATYAGDKARYIRVPQTVDCLQGVINVIPLQLLSYHLAVKRGFNVDQPRNLAKSVTVTEE